MNAEMEISKNQWRSPGGLVVKTAKFKYYVDNKVDNTILLLKLNTNLLNS